MEIKNEEPKVKLVKYFQNSYDHAVAAARTCYSSRVIDEKEINEGHRERIGKGCFESGHHTVFQHATFNFSIENVSRHFLWAFLHSHPFYNSDQQSQRYVKLNEIKAAIPPLEGEALELYKDTIIKAWDIYNQLTAILLADLIKLEEKSGKKIDDTIKKQLEKKAIEIARYVVPVAAHAALTHTLSGVTLYRLYKLVNQYPTQWEAKIIINKMIEEIKKVDPVFFKDVSDSVPLEETLEYKFMHDYNKQNPEKFNEEFDNELGNYSSKLVSYLPNGDKIMADAVRQVMGKVKSEISDEEAIDYVLNPKKNSYLIDTLNVSTISPLMRAMNHPYFVFKKKISHSADSQNQRHRMTPATRPVMIFADTKNPDYITPSLINKNPEAKKIYDNWMGHVWNAKNKLVDNGVKLEFAQYLLPNAVAVRIIESTNFLNLWHKFRMRLCLTAQMEIWKCSVEELEQIRKVFPKLAEHIGPNCILRYKGAIKPFCTEGQRWCSFPVWIWKDFKEANRPV